MLLDIIYKVDKNKPIIVKNYMFVHFISQSKVSIFVSVTLWRHIKIFLASFPLKN